MPKIEKILMVDDDPIFLTLAEFIIRKELPNIQIYKATNGEEAVDFLEEQSVDTILLDLNMPIMNGWDFLNEMERRGKNHRIFLLTSSIDPSDRQKAKDNPLVKSMLEKPLDQEKVNFALR